MKNIIPYLWYDNQASEAVDFYCSLFPQSKILSKNIVTDTPSGDCESVSFELWGQRFEAISAGPYFQFNPSISFMVNFDPLFFQDHQVPNQAAKDKLNGIWQQLSQGGVPLMELGKYDFSPLYGWIQDRYGLSWQLILTDPEGDPRPPIMPSMLFVGENCGKAADAGAFYRSVFPDSKAGMLVKYPAGIETESQDDVMFSDFQLGEIWLTAMDSADNHDFQFNEAVSFLVACRDQKEIDYYWSKLSAVPEAERCGWLKDRYGVSWQIVPDELNTMLETGNEKQRQAVTQAFLKMKKFQLADLRFAFEHSQ